MENMHSQWDPEIFPALVKRAPTIEEHAQLGYPTPTAPGHGVEINGARPPSLAAPTHLRLESDSLASLPAAAHAPADSRLAFWCSP